MDELFNRKESSVVSSNRILYTPSAFARNSLLHLQEIGELKAIRPHASGRSKLASFLFFTVVDGKGSLKYGEKEYPLGKGDCVFIDCTIPYRHTTMPEHLWRLKWIHFYGPTTNQIYEKYKERGGRPVFTPDDSAPFLAVWNEMVEVAGSADYMRDMLINQHLSSLLTLIMSESWHPEDQSALPPKKRMIVPVKSFLDTHYGEKITLDDLASQFYINKYYLTKTFKEQFGVSITAYLLNLRITKAKQLLRFSEKSVEEIGIECGLGAAQYFSQTFKSVEGVPPSVYRRQW